MFFTIYPFVTNWLKPNGKWKIFTQNVFIVYTRPKQIFNIRITALECIGCCIPVFDIKIFVQNSSRNFAAQFHAKIYNEQRAFSKKKNGCSAVFVTILPWIGCRFNLCCALKCLSTINKHFSAQQKSVNFVPFVSLLILLKWNDLQQISFGQCAVNNQPHTVTPISAHRLWINWLIFRDDINWNFEHIHSWLPFLFRHYKMRRYEIVDQMQYAIGGKK